MSIVALTVYILTILFDVLRKMLRSKEKTMSCRTEENWNLRTPFISYTNPFAPRAYETSDDKGLVRQGCSRIEPQVA